MAICLLPHCESMTEQRRQAPSVARWRASSLGKGTDPCSLPPPQDGQLLLIFPSCPACRLVSSPSLAFAGSRRPKPGGPSGRAAHPGTCPSQRLPHGASPLMSRPQRPARG